MKFQITIGTRSSKLAKWQANYIKGELHRLFPEFIINIKEIKTKGDYIIDTALSKIGSKGIFTKEIEDALLSKEIDLAVHSLKDLPTKLPEGLKIGAILNRESPHDVLISKNKTKFCDLKTNSNIGTSSLRRLSQFMSLRQDLKYLSLRGNLDTRIRKLEEGQYEAIVAAYAGVKRLGLEEKVAEHFNPKDILPAVCQGILVIEIRENNKAIEDIISRLNDKEASLISTIERAFLETLQGGCQVPIGAYTEINDNSITLHGFIGSTDGRKTIRDKIVNYELRSLQTDIKSQTDLCRKIGIQLAEKLLQNGGDKILKEITR